MTHSAAAVVRNPVPDRPQIHQIELPLSWRRASRNGDSSTPASAADCTEVYLIEGDPLTLIDTGVRSEESLATFVAALDRLGFRIEEIERVVVTHAHRDHFGLAATLRNAGARFECCVHEADAGLVEDYFGLTRERFDGMTALFHEFGVPEWGLAGMRADRERGLALAEAEAASTGVDRRLDEGDRIEWKDWGLRVVHAPGHTPGHILLEDEAGGVLFTGDLIMAQAVPQAENFYLEGQADPTDPLRRRPRFRGLVEMRSSLRRLRSRRDKWLLPGYGAAIQRAERVIRDTLLYYDVRLQRIDRGLRHLAAMGQEVTAFEVWKALFDSAGDSGIRERRAGFRGSREPNFEVMESQLLLVIGALDCLESDGLLVTERRPDGVLTHHHR